MKIFVLALLFVLNSHAEPLVCSDLFAPLVGSHTYPAGIDPVAKPDGYMQIGYEAEYLFSEGAAILRDYAPRDIALGEWLAKTDDARVEWLRARFKDKPEHAAATGLFKITPLAFMPDELIVDATGNIEIVLAPIDTYEAWSSAVDTIVARYGVGSQQAMVSEPREAVFGLPEGGVRPALGWLVFTNMRDMFAKLESGAARYAKDATKPPAQFMDHPFLGPMTKLKRDIMEKYLAANARGLMYDEESKKFVRKRDLSFKYTGGPSYRPDIAAPARFSWEIRNAHKDVLDLKTKVRRDLLTHEQGIAGFAPFADVPAFDTLATFKHVPAEVQKLLMELFPSKADPRFQYPADDHRALETYRNFALPLGNFERLANALAETPAEGVELHARANAARETYVSAVGAVAAKVAAGTLTREQARADVMGAICQWSMNSGLAPAFEARAAVFGFEPEAEDQVDATAANEEIDSANPDVQALKK